MARTKQTARKGNKGLPKATHGRKGRGSGGGIGGGHGSGGGSGHGGSGGGGSSGGSGGGGDGNRNGNRNADGKGKVPGGRFMKQLEHRPPPAVPK